MVSAWPYDSDSSSSRRSYAPLAAAAKAATNSVRTCAHASCSPSPRSALGTIRHSPVLCWYTMCLAALPPRMLPKWSVPYSISQQKEYPP
ncbi:hypothetical protein ABR737_22370 [Streptomyces sp. Edi2]|uniref:hypothetical protein n=1 Tax=Streptomyces sp. Edi2 TaxID=3162528 RepID=UPI0033067181